MAWSAVEGGRTLKSSPRRRSRRSAWGLEIGALGRYKGAVSGALGGALAVLQRLKQRCEGAVPRCSGLGRVLAGTRSSANSEIRHLMLD